MGKLKIKYLNPMTDKQKEAAFGVSIEELTPSEIIEKYGDSAEGVIVVNQDAPNIVAELGYDDPYIIHAMPTFHEGKKFVCKGLHQYREVRTQENNEIKSIWVCQCGRQL